MLRFCVLLGFALLLSAGCGPSGPKTSTVKGQVSLDGKPLEDGEISFGVAGNVPNVLPIKAGAYSGTVREGKNRVEIRAYRMGAPTMMGNERIEGSKENYLPARFNSDSAFTAEVTAGGTNDFPFAVTSR